MEYLITESQLKVIINEQSMGGMASPQYLAGSVNKELQQMDPHTLMSIAQIGTSFIPFVGPLISAGIGLADAKMYYSEGDKKTAGITAALSMIPFVGSLVSKIPGVKQLGSKGISLLASKLSKGSKNLTKAESEIVNAVKTYSSQVQSELTKMGPKLKGVVKELEMYKGNFIKKYGQQKYNELIVKYLSDGIDKKTLLSQIKNVNIPKNKIVKVYRAGEKKSEMFYVSPNKDYVLKYYKKPNNEMYSMKLNLGRVLDLTKLNPESIKITELIDFMKKNGVKFTKDEIKQLLKQNISKKSTFLNKQYRSMPLYLHFFKENVISNAVKRSGFNSIKQFETSAYTGSKLDYSKGAESYLILNKIN
jgi:hypothetical protein